jgi:hypothetical protein
MFCRIMTDVHNLLLSAAIVEELELIWVFVRGVLICFCFHVIADVSMALLQLFCALKMDDGDARNM